MNATDDKARKAANHFIRWAKHRLPAKTIFSLTYEDEVDEGEKPYWYLNVGVPVKAMNFATGSDPFVDVEDLVLQLAQRYGLLKRFEQSGAGCGSGVRDVNFIQKNRP